MEIKGKSAIVTGGSSGLGRAVAIALAAAGARSVAIIARDEARMKAVAAEVQQAGANCIWVKADVRSDREVRDAFGRIASEFGTIDLVVNNAGVGAHKRFSELDAKEADFILDVNVRGVMNVMRAAVDQMKRQDGGVIVNVASALGKIPLFGHSVYTASKAAVVALSRVARKEIPGSYRVRLLCFCPGMIDTPFQDDRRDEIQRLPRFVLQKPEKTACDMIKMIRREKKESFGRRYLALVHFFYRLLAG